MKKLIALITLTTLSLTSFAESTFRTKIPQPDYISNDWDGDRLINSEDLDDDNDGINDVDDSTPFGGKAGAFTPPPILADDISCGDYHCYALVDGTVYSVGHNPYGQLGREGTTNQSTWGATNLSGVSEISAGIYHGYALVSGTVYSVGGNNQGQLASGDSLSLNRHTWESTSLSGVSDIEASNAHHGYALVGGTVYSVGRNLEGQLGRAGTTTQYSWEATSLSGVSDITAGQTGGYSLVSGTVYSVGDNYYGQLGLGDTTNRSAWTESVITP
jgi:hypothetical protein